jgi:hypothetical protein
MTIRRPIPVIVDDNLRRKFIDRVLIAPELATEYGTLGKYSGGGWTVDVPGRPGYAYVTMTDGTIAEAENLSAGGAGGYPVRLRREYGSLRVLGLNMTMLSGTPGVTTTVIQAGATPRHHHRMGSGQEYYLQGLMFEPGAVHLWGDDTAYLYIEPMVYWYNGTRKYFEGDKIAWAGYLPAGTDTRAWVQFGIDPSANTITALTGAEYESPDVLEASLLFADTALTGLALVAVCLSEGQTAPPTQRDFFDLRPYVGAAGYSGEVNWAVPGSIGATTPNAGAFTLLNVNTTGATTGEVRIKSANAGYAIRQYRHDSVALFSLNNEGAMEGGARGYVWVDDNLRVGGNRYLLVGTHSGFSGSGNNTYIGNGSFHDAASSTTYRTISSIDLPLINFQAATGAARVIVAFCTDGGAAGAAATFVPQALFFTGGKLALGTNVDPTAQLEVFQEDSATNAITNVGIFTHNSSGTPAAGFGTGLLIQGESSTTAAQSLGRIVGSWNVATHASREADLIFSAFYTGTEREGMRIRGGSSNVQIAFYGKTPVSSPTGYTTFGNLTTDRTLDANSTTLDEVADVLGTLIEDLKAVGLIAA